MDRVRTVFSVKTGPVLTDPELTKTGPRIQITSRRFGPGQENPLCYVQELQLQGRMRRKPEEEEQDFF
jgi:hypothetical protein